MHMKFFWFKQVSRSKQIRINKLGKCPYNKKKDRVLNFEIPPADHLTKKFILNPVEGSRSARTRGSNQNQSMGWQWGQGPWKCFPYIQVSDVLFYKPIPIIYRPLLLQKFSNSYYSI